MNKSQYSYNTNTNWRRGAAGVRVWQAARGRAGAQLRIRCVCAEQGEGRAGAGGRGGHLAACLIVARSFGTGSMYSTIPFPAKNLLRSAADAATNAWGWALNSGGRGFKTKHALHSYWRLLMFESRTGFTASIIGQWLAFQGKTKTTPRIISELEVNLEYIILDDEKRKCPHTRYISPVFNSNTGPLNAVILGTLPRHRRCRAADSDAHVTPFELRRSRARADGRKGL